MDSILQHFTDIWSIIWAIILVVFFFGASIFVHELGHFLAARWRGLKVERFSIGFGKKLYSWNRNGVEYIIAMLPLGGYVALPQLADMGPLEGGYEDTQEPLPPISYTDKVIVSAMGAVFNVIFAFFLAFILYFTGLPVTEDMATTTIGYVSEYITNDQEEKVISPASVAGLKAGDRIISVDGKSIRDWPDLTARIVLGTKRTESGEPLSQFVIERDGQEINLAIQPILDVRDSIRKVGISPAIKMIVHKVYPDSPAEIAGLRTEDRILEVANRKVYRTVGINDIMKANPDKAVDFLIERQGQQLRLRMKPALATVTDDGEQELIYGFVMRRSFDNVPINPIKQLKDHFVLTIDVLTALLNPSSNIGIDKISGPIGIGEALYRTSRISFRIMLSIVVLININLAIINMLPIPVLDGGHILFATIGKLRGKSLPQTFIMATQSVFMILLLTFMVYVIFNDVIRAGDNRREDKEYDQLVSRRIEPVFERGNKPITNQPSPAP